MVAAFATALAAVGLFPLRRMGDGRERGCGVAVLAMTAAESMSPASRTHLETRVAEDATTTTAFRRRRHGALVLSRRCCPRRWWTVSAERLPKRGTERESWEATVPAAGRCGCHYHRCQRGPSMRTRHGGYCLGWALGSGGTAVGKTDGCERRGFAVRPVLPRRVSLLRCIVFPFAHHTHERPIFGSVSLAFNTFIPRPRSVGTGDTTEGVFVMRTKNKEDLL